MLRKLSVVLVAGLFFAGCAHQEEKKDEKPVQPVETPAPAPAPAPEPAPAPAPPPPPTCTALQILDGNTCLDVATTLVGFRLEMPCKPGHKPEECAAATPKATKAVTLGGKAGQQFDVTLRVRGVVELNGYAGGQIKDFFSVGGKASDKKASIWELAVANPAASFFLNAGNPGKRSWPVDYTQTVRVAAGSTLTLNADTQDPKMVANRDLKNQPNIVADVPPAPTSFDGQFVQIDVVSIALVP